MVAEFFGVAPDTIRKEWRARGCPWNPGEHDLSAIFQWRIGDLKRRPTARDDNGDGLLDGVESPELERYRAARAALAELELSKRRGEVVDVETARTVFGRVAEVLRNAGGELERKHGGDAASILSAAIRSVDREIDAAFAGVDREPDDGDAGNNAADSQVVREDGDRAKNQDNP